MSLSVTFRRAARAEFIEAAAWYESQRLGLGVEFIAEIERSVDAAAERPTTYAAIYKDVRRVVANRFPFSVYFRAEERRTVFLAVFHGRRNPVIWQGRS
jgi:plasmid stabilization system protein ParE